MGTEQSSCALPPNNSSSQIKAGYLGLSTAGSLLGAYPSKSLVGLGKCSHNHDHRFIALMVVGWAMSKTLRYLANIGTIYKHAIEYLEPLMALNQKNTLTH